MKGEKFALERRKQVADITKEMLDSGEEIVLKPYVYLTKTKAHIVTLTYR